MRRLCFIVAIAIPLFTLAGFAQTAGAGGPYKVLKTAKVGGEGGWDYIYADVAGRRLYIPRGGTRGGRGHRHDAGGRRRCRARITVFNLDTLEPVGEIPDTRRQRRRRSIRSRATASRAASRSRCSTRRR